MSEVPDRQIRLERAAVPKKERKCSLGMFYYITHTKVPSTLNEHK